MGSNYDSLLGMLNLNRTAYSGSERFLFQGKDIGHSLLDCWSWAFSDMRNNVYRGAMAKYIVATALGLTPPDGNYARAAWSPFDLLTKSGKRVEVKSSAYLQSWSNEISQISFSVAPARGYEDGSTSYGKLSARNSDVYVFCLFTALTSTVPVFDLDYWQFRVVPTSILDDRIPNQKTITLGSLDRLIRSWKGLSIGDVTHVMFDRLGETIACI